MSLAISPELSALTKGEQPKADSISVVQATDTQLDVAGALTLNRDYGVIATGVVSVPAAGTRVQLPAKPLEVGVTLQWDDGNTGKVYIGGANVSAANGLYLNATIPAIEREVADLSDIYVDVATAGDSVRYWAQ